MHCEALELLQKSKEVKKEKTDVLQEAEMPILYTMKLDRDHAPCVCCRNTLWLCSEVLLPMLAQ